MSKEMMKICVMDAMEHKDDVHVKAPPDVSNMRKTVDDLRNWHKEKEGDKGEEGEEKKGGFLSKVGGMVSDAAEAVADLTQQGVQKGLNVFADGLEAAINNVEEPFVTIGKDLLEVKGLEIVQCFEEYVGGIVEGKVKFGGVFDDPVFLVRGQSPHGQAEYDAAQPDGITDNMMTKVDMSLYVAIIDQVKVEMDKHATVKNWNSAIESYNSAAERAKDMGCEVKPIELDIQMYITVEVVKEIARLMADKEKLVRQSSDGVCKNFPGTFSVMFSGKPYDESNYKKFIQEGKDAGLWKSS